jgi:hypothetical protein
LAAAAAAAAAEKGGGGFVFSHSNHDHVAHLEGAAQKQLFSEMRRLPLQLGALTLQVFGILAPPSLRLCSQPSPLCQNRSLRLLPGLGSHEPLELNLLEQSTGASCQQCLDLRDSHERRGDLGRGPGGRHGDGSKGSADRGRTKEN